MVRCTTHLQASSKVPGSNWWGDFRSRLRSTTFDPVLVFNTLRQDSGHDLSVYDSQPPEKLLCIDIRLQKLVYVSCGSVEYTYSISTSKNGKGCRQNTGCTPIGWHIISEKIGSDATLGTIFKGRRAAGHTDDLRSDIADDLITSRILWLTGLQPGFNRGGQVDSKERYIYIHGTAQEHLLGKPVSEGCIRMANRDVLELFEVVDTNTLVFVG